MNILIVNQYAGSQNWGWNSAPIIWPRNGEDGESPGEVTGDFSPTCGRRTPVPFWTGGKTVEGSAIVSSKPRLRRQRPGAGENVFAFCRKLATKRSGSPRQNLPTGCGHRSSTHPFDGRGQLESPGLPRPSWIYEVHDLWPLSPMELYGLQGGPPAHPFLIRREVRRLSRKSDGVVSIPGESRPLPGFHRGVAQNYQHIPNRVGLPRESRRTCPKGSTRSCWNCSPQPWGILSLVPGGFSSAANAFEDLVFAAALAPPGIAFGLMGTAPTRE